MRWRETVFFLVHASHRISHSKAEYTHIDKRKLFFPPSDQSRQRPDCQLSRKDYPYWLFCSAACVKSDFFFFFFLPSAQKEAGQAINAVIMMWHEVTAARVSSYVFWPSAALSPVWADITDVDVILFAVAFKYACVQFPMQGKSDMKRNERDENEYGKESVFVCLGECEMWQK